MTADFFANAVRKYCLVFGGSVTSWGRTPAHNVSVGGDRRSLHQVWKAADVVYDAHLNERAVLVVRARLGNDWRPTALPDLAERRHVATQFGLYVHPEDDHDHIRPLDETWTV